jgi:hypothetical protein
MLSGGDSLNISVLATYIIPWRKNVAVECSANFHAIPLNYCVSSDLNSSIGQNVTASDFNPFSQCHNLSSYVL